MVMDDWVKRIKEAAHDVCWFFASRWRRLSRCLGWLPVTWGICDCCYNSAYEVLRHQLAAMERFHRKHGTALDSEKRADEMRYAVLLLDRLIANTYLERALIPHKRRWGEGDWWVETVPGTAYTLYRGMRYEKAATEQEQERANLEARRCYRHADYMEQQDIDELFQLLHKRHRYWGE